MRTEQSTKCLYHVFIAFLLLLTKVGLSIRNRSRMLSNIVGWVTSCVRLNSSKRSMNSSYWCECLQSGARVGILSVQDNLG